MKVAIIGSGLSGLTVGATLSRAGHQVDVFEQFRRAGGVTAPYRRDGFTWDLGQLLVEGLGPDEPVGEILADLGVQDRVRIRVEDRGYVFPDFKIEKPLQYQGVRWRIDQLQERFPEDARGLDRYWTDYLRFTSVMTLARRAERSEGLVARYQKLKLYMKLLPLLSRKDWNAQQLMDDYFASEKLKMVFTSILADFFTDPSDFVGLGVFALNPEASFDKRMPRDLATDTQQLYHYSVLGGIGTWADALVQEIQAAGGRVHTSRPISRILVDRNRVIGVVDSSGSSVSADVVVASGGAKETFLKLVGPDHFSPDFVSKLRTIPLMDSVFMVHLGVDFDPSPYVHGVCTYYYGTYDLARGLADAKAGVYHGGRDGFVVHIPSFHSPEMAPLGHHAMTIYTICPDNLADGAWHQRKEEEAERLIAYAERHTPGLGQHIQVREILTPEDFRVRARLDHHAFGGIAPIMGAWRVPHQSPVKGLWFVGAQSESGGGVNNVVPGAFKTAQQIARSGSPG